MFGMLGRIALRVLGGLACLLAAGETLAPSLVPTESQCGGRIVISAPGYLTSPGYPGNYPLSQQCEWLIEAPEPDQRIFINFNPHFDLEDRECKYDYIEVFDGADSKTSPLLKHCGKIAPGPLQSSRHQMLIRFVSDYETSGAGFSIRYEINKIAHTDCSSNLTAPSGVIRSPGYPERYPNNLACSYTVLAPSGQEIQLLFSAFSLEPDTAPPSGVTCRYDWLEIWDGYPLVGLFIGRYCGDSNPGRVVAHTGILSITMTTDTAIAKEGFEATYTIRQPKHSQAASCEEPLGMESGDIGPGAVRARSQYNPSWAPDRARLNFPHNGWTPGEDSVKEWIEIDLGFLKYLSAIGIQGAVSKETKKSYFVKTYKVLISTNGEDWVTIKEDGKHKVFKGNKNPEDEVRDSLPKPVLTRFVRIRPLSWENGVCMRIELYGCRISDATCSAMLGMISGRISDSQISVWPTPDRSWLPDSVRLMTGRNGWTLPPSSPASLPGGGTGSPGPDQDAPYLQLDLGGERWVSGVLVQGGRLRDKPVFLKRFRLATSRDGSVWSPLVDNNSTNSKIFQGNMNHDTPEVRQLSPPVMMHFLRLYPERGTPEGLGLRIELLGCEPQEPTTPAATLAVTAAPATTTQVAMLPEKCGGQEGCSMFDSTGSITETPGIDPFFIPEYLWFSCDFGWGNPSYCVWTHDTDGGADWLFQLPGMPTDPHLPTYEHSGNPGIFIYAALTGEEDVDSKLRDEIGERRSARLVSPTVTGPVSEMCVSFWYYAAKETLHTPGAHTHSKEEHTHVTEETRHIRANTLAPRTHTHISGAQTHTGSLQLKLRWLVEEEEERILEEEMRVDMGLGGTAEERRAGGEGDEGVQEKEIWSEQEEAHGERRPVETLEWLVMGEETPRWREGRMLLPSSNTSYQVVFEAVGPGYLALDDIKILEHVSSAECINSEARAPPTLDPPIMFSTPPPYIHLSSLQTNPSGLTDSGVVDPGVAIDSDMSEVASAPPSSVSVGDVVAVGAESGMVLRTLDPILITIIAMSALGVLLGAVCGVLLYCACGAPPPDSADEERRPPHGNGPHGDTHTHTVSAMHNYNFQLVKKDKLLHTHTEKPFTEV